MQEVVILGAGMAGFGAAHRLHELGVKSVMFERNRYYGGNAASFRSTDAFIFDVGPHISFTKVKRIQDLFAESVDFEFETIQAGVNNYWQGHLIKHPVQCNLYGLPVDLVVKAISDFVYANNHDCGENKNYSDWLIASYGKTLAETFPMQYTKKFHTTTADNMSTDWIGPRMYRPGLEEVLSGALSPQTTDVHYVSHFRYPTHGGFGSFFNRFLRQTDLKMGFELVNLDPGSRKLYFANGTEMTYDKLISSIPLPELISMIEGVTADVVDAAQKLACTTCVVVNIGINRDDISETQWTYFYEDDFFFTRLSYPHMLSPNNSPRGTGTIQAEVYYSNKYKPLDREPQECIAPVISDLIRCGVVREDDEILYRDARIIPYANVIFDLERADALSTVHGYLDDIGIAYCGRYGEWGYLWTDESFLSGENAAQRIVNSEDL